MSNTIKQEDRKVPHNFCNSTLIKKYFQNNSANFDNSSFSSISVLQLMRLLLAQAQIPVFRPVLKYRLCKNSLQKNETLTSCPLFSFFYHFWVDATAKIHTLMKSSKNNSIFLPGFYLVMCLMKSLKSFCKIVILKTRELLHRCQDSLRKTIHEMMHFQAQQNLIVFNIMQQL